MMGRRRWFPAVLWFGALWGCSSGEPTVTLFHAPSFSPWIDAVRHDLETKSHLRLITEVGGSQVLCRKVVDLGRECDILLLADAEQFKTLTPALTPWRIEVAHDEIVLGVGIRAQRVDEAEKDWVSVVKDPQVILGRVDEKLGPIGYRTLLLWQLQESAGYPGLRRELEAKTSKVLDHAEHLAAMLRSGDVEYGFLYRTTCLHHGIRMIRLAPEINMGTPGKDYTRAEVTYTRFENSAAKQVAVRGSLITLGLSIPANAPHPQLAADVVRQLLSDYQPVLAEKGFSVFTPRFFGSRQDYETFQSVSQYSGPF